MKEAVIFDGIRSAFGRHGGALARLRPDDLAASLILKLLQRNNVAGEKIEDVILGNTNQAGEDSRNLARHAAMLAGLPVEVPGITLNRLCGSGLAAILDAARTVMAEQGELFVVGGVESMSRAPYVMSKPETAFATNQSVEDSTMGARFPNPRITEEYGNPSLIETADRVAADLEIPREASDKFAFASQDRYQRAKAAGFFNGEIVPVTVPSGSRKSPPIEVTEDEHPRADSKLEKLATLKPVFSDGVVTAGSASGINDGGAALLVGERSFGEQLGLKPRARIISGAVAGVHPMVMGLGPVPATEKLMRRTGLTTNDMDVIELNEAFAPQVLGCLKQLGIDFEDERVNPNGGAIAIGHPLGASGARIALTALRQLEATGGKYALITMCIGVGQGIAAIIERIES